MLADIIDTIITLDPDTMNEQRIVLPYQSYLGIQKLIDKSEPSKKYEGDEVFRFCIGSGDTPLDITNQLQRISDYKFKNRNNIINRLLISSGEITLELNRPIIVEHIYPHGRYFDIECAEDKVKRIEYVIMV